VIERIKETVSLADILREAGVNLVRGRGACPICGSKNKTAFSVKNGRGLCFRCGFRGDVVDLIKALHGMDTKAAIKHLADRAGIKTGPLTFTERKAMRRAKQERERRAKLITRLDAWAQGQRDIIAPLLQGARRLLARGVSYREAVKLGAVFFDDMAFLEYTHDDILCRGDRGTHLALYREEKGI